MTATNHAMTGAVIALVVRQPALVVPLALVSHYILDALPHFGLGKDVATADRNKSALFWMIIRVDAALLLACWIVLVTQALRGVIGWIVPLGSLVAYAPDTTWLYRLWWERKYQSWRPGILLTRFHEKIQWFERPLGLFVEIAWFGSMVVLLGELA